MNGTQPPALAAVPANPQTQLAVYQQPSALAAFEPRSIAEALTLAKLYADSKLAPQFTSQAQVMLVMATGAELGIPATAALRAIYVGPGNKIGLESKLKLALCQRAKQVCRYFRMVESTDEKATYETLRVGDELPVRVTFTIQDAEKAGWVKDGGPYKKTPRRQLRWRAIGELADLVYPELLLGLPSVEELMDEAGGELPVRPVAVLDGEMVEQPQEAANLIEEIPTFLARLGTAIANAKTPADCDAVAVEAQTRLEKGTPEFESLRAAVKARKAALRDAAKGERQPGEEG